MLTRNRRNAGINQTSEPDAFISNQGEWHYNGLWQENAPTWIEKVSGQESDIDMARFDERFFPVHSPCEEILQRFTQYQGRFRSSNLPKSVKDFVDACITCQDFAKEESEKIRRLGKNRRRPPLYEYYGGVEWSHLYFGARRCWTAPWHCIHRQEYLCANPISYQIDISHCLTTPKISSQNLFSFSTARLRLQDLAPSNCPLMECPTEIIQLIASHLPLRSSINLHASSLRLSALLTTSETDFWRSQTLKLHPWFWELGAFSSSTGSSSYENWEGLLATLTMSRYEIMKKGKQKYWHDWDHFDVPTEVRNAGDYDCIDDDVAQLMPAGLRNRQRIWMCLEFIDIDSELTEEGDQESIYIDPESPEKEDQGSRIHKGGE